MVNPLRNKVEQRRRPVPPDDFEDTEEFLEHVRKVFQDDLDADRENREEALEDLRFVAGKQWDKAVEQARVAKGKPVLTINRLPSFVNTLVGNQRQTDVMAKIIPDHGGTKDVARIRQGIIRAIQKTSRADRAYNKAFENMVICGIGNYQLSLDFANDDVFEQDINVVPIANALAVVWDRTSIEPTGQDAEHVFVVDHIPKREFEERYPDAVTTANLSNDTRLLGDVLSSAWVTDTDVRVVSYWRMRSETRTLALLNKPQGANDAGATEVVDVTDIEEGPELDDILSRLVQDANGEPVIRESERKFAEMYLLTGKDLLAGPYRLPISRVPVFRNEGWVVDAGEERVRFGLVRWLRDPQRLHNLWRSVVAERIARSPKAVWLAADNAVQGREEAYRNSHLSDDPLLIWNADSGSKPERTDPPQIEQALVQEASLTTQDLRDVSNIHEANLGMTSNEVSARGINARRSVGENGMFIYHDNMVMGIEESARVMNELIPMVYDTVRTVKIMGAEASEGVTLAKINDVFDENSVDVTAGKYAVTVTTGPSFATKRQEAAESMLNMVNAMPQTMQVAADKIVEAQDWPGAEEIARRLRQTLPPGMVDPNDLTPREEQQAEQRAQRAAQQQQIQIAQLQAQFAEQQARTIEMQARAQAAVSQAEKAASEVGVQAFRAQTDAAKAMADTDISEFEAATGRFEAVSEDRNRREDNHLQRIQLLNRSLDRMLNNGGQRQDQ